MVLRSPRSRPAGSRHSRGVLTLTLLLLGGSATSGACSVDCSGVDCPANFSATWPEGSLPADVAAIRLCADGDCSRTVVRSNDRDRVREITGGGVDDSVDVVIEAFDVRGRSVAHLESTHRSHGGGCCGPRLRLTVDWGERAISEQ